MAPVRPRRIRMRLVKRLKIASTTIPMIKITIIGERTTSGWPN